jgi:iron complex outermembrane receptor protein
MLINSAFNSGNAMVRYVQFGALLFLMSGAAVGQQKDNGGAAKRSDVIEEVIVSARRVDESLQKAPVSITDFSELDLRQVGASETKDIAQLTPNLTIRNAPGTNDDYAFSLRGVAAAEPSLAIDPAVGLYIDGVYIARNAGMAFDVVNMKRIEVLSGPQGRLFGRNSIGGAVNIITTRPTGEFGYTVELGAGNNDNHRAKVVVDLPAWGDWAASLAFFDKGQGGWVDSVYGGELGGQMGTAWRGALRWEASESFSDDYTYTLTDRAGNGQISQLTHVRPIYSDPNGQFYGGPFYEQAAAAAASVKRLDRLIIEKSRSRENTSRIDAHTLTLDWELNSTLDFPGFARQLLPLKSTLLRT